MLVLARGVGEKILIGDNISLEIISIKGSSVRVSVDAPSGVSVVSDGLTDSSHTMDLRTARQTAQAMIDSGGSFVKALGQSMLMADTRNLTRLMQAFPGYCAIFYLRRKQEICDV